MKNFQSENSMGLTELSSEEMVQVTGGWEWLDNIASGIGYVLGKTAHAVIDGFLIITGNYEVH